MVTVIVIREAV